MNVNIDFKYQEQDLTTHKKNSNILSILSTQDGFVFYVYNKDDTQLLHFEKRTFPPFEYFKSYIDAYKSLIKEILSIYDLSEIRVMFASARVTFIPTAIYTHEQKENLYAINFDQNEFNSIEVFPNTNYQCHILYPVPEWLILFKEEFDIDIRFFKELKLKYNFALKREHILRYLNFLNLHLCE
jgi:uncharacterized protein DUF3822